MLSFVPSLASCRLVFKPVVRCGKMLILDPPEDPSVRIGSRAESGYTASRVFRAVRPEFQLRRSWNLNTSRRILLFETGKRLGQGGTVVFVKY